MHILVINDDGPPSQKSSPYVHAFIETLQRRGHLVSVVLPHQQRSWIGKAHFVGQLIEPTYFRPGTVHQDNGSTHDRPSASSGKDEEEWILVNGTPATCAQLGLFHFFQDRGPVDLVISGPNYGRNSTALFSLSSGTVGGAMEAALFRKKAIALSFAFDSRDHNPILIAGGCRQALKIIEHLHQNWAPDVDVYNINVPIVDGVEDCKVLYTYTLQNYWSTGSSFEEIETNEDDPSPENQEMKIRESLESDGGKDPAREPKTMIQKHKHFKFAPKFSDVTQSIEEGLAGNDGWAIKQRYTSVTPLKANFMHVPSTRLGELKLQRKPISEHPTSIIRRYYALIDYEDPYVQPLILQAIASLLPRAPYTLISSVSALPTPTSPLLQITSYESINFHHLLAHPSTSVANAYVIRKALIRKHYLAHTVSAWCSKNPRGSPLVDHVKQTLDFELDYVEFLDEALVEVYELHESFARNATLPPEACEWWILKPGMSDRGQGIRLFSTEAQLRAIFEEWEPEDLPDTETDSELTTAAEESQTPGIEDAADGVITSQLRHFVVQQYIHPPLLFPSHQNRKFHLRSYVLALGALRVYIYKDLLALFAPLPYTAPSSSSPFNPSIHLTNTCVHSTPSSPPGTVSLFSTLPSAAANLLPDWKSTTWTQIVTATAELFLAAARTQSTHFQALPNAFEVFGLDWLVDANGRAWLLEVNAFPDFAQSGDEGREVVRGLWEGVVGLVVGEFFSSGVPRSSNRNNRAEIVEEEEKEEGEKWGMERVLNVDLGRRR